MFLAWPNGVCDVPAQTLNLLAMSRSFCLLQVCARRSHTPVHVTLHFQLRRPFACYLRAVVIVRKTRHPFTNGSSGLGDVLFPIYQRSDMISSFFPSFSDCFYNIVIMNSAFRISDNWKTILRDFYPSYTVARLFRPQFNDSIFRIDAQMHLDARPHSLACTYLLWNK